MGGPGPLDRALDKRAREQELQRVEEQNQQSSIAWEFEAFKKGCKWFPTSEVSLADVAYSVLDPELRAKVVDYVQAMKEEGVPRKEEERHPTDLETALDAAFDKFATQECSTGKERMVLTAEGLASLFSVAGYQGLFPSAPAYAALRVIKEKQATDWAEQMKNSKLSGTAGITAKRSEPASALTRKQFRDLFKDQTRAEAR